MTAPPLRPRGTEMTIWNPWSISPAFDERLAPLLDALWPGRAVGGFTPTGDLTETDDRYVLELDLPGIEKKDVTVEVVGRRISVSGTRSEPDREGTLRHSTRATGTFVYEATLPSGVDEKQATATLADGVLRITLPKAPASKGTRVAIG